MTRIHDMGGRFGDGPVTPEAEDAPIFPQDWHARALAVTLACGSLGQWNIDTSRHAREKLSPQDYTRFSYYEKWISALADLLVDTGAITREELSGATQPQDSDLTAKKLTLDRVAGVLAAGAPSLREGGPSPCFSVGQKVRTRRQPENTQITGGHTRLPAYAAGAVGHVVMLHGTHVLPDSAAHRMGEAPEPLYAVAFPASELWAAPEHPGDEVILDLWQSYLEPA